MVEPEKPFACSIPDCGMTFTNEDHLHVHTKKHDMMLLGLEQKVYVADQTPTPTRFIRNCEDLGIFQDLQNVNPFDEGFKQAMETAKHGLLSLENAATDTLRCHQMPEGALPEHDVLHTPQFMDPRDSALFTSNNQRNITISRSSSDESGVIKEYETTTISKLTNEVTTISRVVNKHDVTDKHPDDVTPSKPDDNGCQNDARNETSVSYTNNVIKIHNNIEIRKDNLIQNIDATKVPVNLIYDSVIKDTSSIIAKDVLLTDTNKDSLKIPPMMSQKSIDFVVDALTSDLCKNDVKKPEVKRKRVPKALPKIAPTNNEINKNNPVESNKEMSGNKNDDYEVIIKLPNGKQVRMKAVEEVATPEKNIENNTKEKLKLAINNKVSQKNPVFLQTMNTAPNLVPISTGTLIPVTIVNTTAPLVQKIPIVPFKTLLKSNQEFKKTVKRKNTSPNKSNDNAKLVSQSVSDVGQNVSGKDDDDCVIVDDDGDSQKKKAKEDLSSRVAASRRYRVRLRETMRRQVAEIKQLREYNQRLVEEKAALQLVITEHMRKCPEGFHLRSTAARLAQVNQTKPNDSML